MDPFLFLVGAFCYVPVLSLQLALWLLRQHVCDKEMNWIELK
jgi:hypothetical protein